MRNTCLARVFRSLSDSRWRTLTEIARETNIGEATVSARIRDLRKTAYGGYRVDRKRMPCAERNRLMHHYRLVPGVMRFDSQAGRALERLKQDPAPPAPPPKPKPNPKPRISLWERPIDVDAMTRQIMLDILPSMRRMSLAIVKGAGR